MSFFARFRIFRLSSSVRKKHFVYRFFYFPDSFFIWNFIIIFVCNLNHLQIILLLPYPRDRLVLPRELLHSRVGEAARGAALLVLVITVPAAAPASHMRSFVVLAETRASFCHKITLLYFSAF